MADIYIYPNTIRAVKVTGAQVREWLERSAGIFNRIDPAKGGEQELVNDKFPAFNFDVIAGVHLQDRRRRSRRRYDVDGKLVDAECAPHQGSHLSGQAGRGRPGLHRRDEQLPRGAAAAISRATTARRRPRRAGPDPRRDHALHRRAQGDRAEGGRIWSLVVPAGVTAIFVTGPGAAAYQPAGIKVEKLGDAPDGFVKYRVVG